MKRRTRRTTGVAAVSLAAVTLLPFTAAAATGDVDVSISNHSGQDVVSGPNVSVETSFTSMSDRPVTRVEFLVDGRVATTQSLEQPVRKGRFIFAWDTRSLSNDIHTIEARAYDADGKTGETKLQLFVDNQAIDQAVPRLRVTVPREDAVVSGQFSVQVQADQGAAVEPLWLLSIKLDDDLIWGGNLNGHSLVNFVYDGTTLTDGPHYIQAAGETKDGRRILSPPIIVIVDKSHGLTQFQAGEPDVNPPGLSDTAPAPTAPTPSPFNPGPDQSVSPQVLAQAQGAGISANDSASGLDSAATLQPTVPPDLHASHPSPAQRHPQGHPNVHPRSSVSHPGLTVAQNAAKSGAASTFTVPGHPTPAAHTTPAAHPAPPASSGPAAPPIRIALAPSAQRPVVQEVDGWYFHGSLDAAQAISPSKRPIVTPTAARVVVVETGGRSLPAVSPLAPSHPAAGAESPESAGQPVVRVRRPNFPPTPIPMAMNPAGARPSIPSLGSGMPVFMPIPVVVTPSGKFSLPVHHPGVTRVAVRPPVSAEERRLPMLMAHQPGTPRWLRVAYDNHWMNFDVPPTVVRGIPAMPFRALFERSGGMVEWHASTQTVTAEKPGRSVELKIGSRKAVVNQQVVQMILPAFLKQGRTMIPIGFVRQAMDVNIRYNRATGEVILTSKHVLAMMMR